MSATRFRGRVGATRLLTILLSILALHEEARAAADAPPAVPSACTDGWMGLKSVSGEFRIWAQCTPEPAADLNLAMEMVDSTWPGMTALMGRPIPDTEGGDAAIDFYLVPANTALTHGTRKIPPIGTNELGSFFTAPPTNGNTCSGMVALRRDRLREAGALSNAAHETFHVFQGAHNCKTLVTAPGGAQPEEFWFSEASAKWAETHFVRATSRAEVHDKLFVRLFQKSKTISLSASSPPAAPYTAYIWPFFMEQERGAKAIGQVWRALAKRNTWDGFMDAVDEALPFAQHFPEFALRNLNRSLGGAISPRYVALDPNFPDESPPVLMFEQPLAAVTRANANTELQQFPAMVPSLKAHYYYWYMDPAVRRIDVDLSKLFPSDRHDAQFLVRSEGAWDLHRLGANTGKVTFCRPEEVYLVLSNPDRTPGNYVSGSFEIKALKEECRGWNGSLSFTAIDNAYHATWNIGVQNLQPNGEPVESVMAVKYSGSERSSSSNCTRVRTARAGGSVPVEVTMTGDAKSGYNINVREQRKLEVTEVVTSTCGPTDTYKSEEIWFNSIGTSVDATVDPKQPGRLIGTHRFAPGGGLDHQFKWNLRRGE